MSSQEGNGLFFELLGNLEIRETALKKLACKINEGERILDIATGSGYLVRNLLDKNANAFIVCLDVDSKSLSKTRSELPDMNYVRADARHLPFKNSSFDCVVTWSALVHINDWRGVIDESFRVSKRMLTAEPHGAFSVRAFRDIKCRHSYPDIEEIQAGFEKYGMANIDRMDFISIISTSSSSEN